MRFIPTLYGIVAPPGRLVGLKYGAADDGLREWTRYDEAEIAILKQGRRNFARNDVSEHVFIE
jgi:hypothetical protein